MVLKAVALWVSVLVLTTRLFKLHVWRWLFTTGANFPSLWASKVLLLLFSYLHMCELSSHCSAQGRGGDEWVNFLPKIQHYCRKGRECLSPELCLLCRCSGRIFVSVVNRWDSVLGEHGYKDVAFCSGLLEIAFLGAVILCFCYSLRLEHFFGTTEIQSSFCDVFLHRAMMAHLSATCNHSHFARLFQKQLIQVNDMFFLFFMKIYVKADMILPWPEKTNCLAILRFSYWNFFGRAKFSEWEFPSFTRNTNQW